MTKSLLFELLVFRLSDIEAKVIQDNGVVTGSTKGIPWSRRKIRIKQSNVNYDLTLWNEVVIINTKNFNDIIPISGS